MEPHIFHIQRLYEQHEPVGAAVASIAAEIPALKCVDDETVRECLDVPFHLASTERSAERFVKVEGDSTH